MKISFNRIKNVIDKVSQATQIVDSLAGNGSTDKEENKKESNSIDNHSAPKDSTKTKKSNAVAKSDNKKNLDGVKRQLLTSTDVLSSIKELCTAAIEAVKYCEQQETERENIRSIRDQNIEIIRSQREIIMHYLDRSFDERKMLFDRHFTLVDRAINTGDNQLLAVELQQINELANSSPFKALTDMKQTQEILNRPGSIIDI